MAQSPTQNYILLPKTDMRFSAESLATSTRQAFSRLTVDTHLDDVLDGDLSSQAVVLDTTRHSGAKLVRVAADELPDLRAQLPGVRIVPEVFYYPQRWMQEVRNKVKPLQGQARVTVKLLLNDAKTGNPIADAVVVAFTNFEQREGEQATSNAQGVVQFRNIGNRTLDQIYIYPKAGHWSFWKQNLAIKTNDIITLQPVKLDYRDAKTFFYPPAVTGQPAGKGVRVGVIDTGVGPHPDLTVAGGLSTVTGEDSSNFADVDEHGTHVAGIIAAHGTSPTGVRGAAPEVELYAYRVFSQNNPGASNFAIIKAIEQAVADGCDIINMSLGGGPSDDATEDAISFAHENGTICFVATGNDGRQPVSFPASYSLSLAVGAMGRKGTFPANTTDAPNVQAPFGTDRKNFVAAFSNIGPEVDFIAPGVGIISSVPGGYAPMSGTSMACPLAAGVAARLLSASPNVLAQPRSAARAEAMIRLLAEHVQSMGFGSTFEGTGMLLV
ncbi:S8 family peptidase [Spirosoma sp. KUDC1026]|uniref:S8 family peptidase n=1 Tax=Spirosoma sp. KUDC1026 TaxID=2745947 RepID=UPI00159BA7AB|nr:S8 family serine peptidase [Spirosoma sp. KUDC1026]QKZ15322.1 S8 family serine peptidase [Spirosoma sp. KUDC1026]